MNRKELALALSEKQGISTKTAEEVIANVTGIIKNEVEAGNKVEIRGFATFGSRVKKATVARNPATGATVNVPEKTVPVFKAAKNSFNFK